MENEIVYTPKEGSFSFFQKMLAERKQSTPSPIGYPPEILFITSYPPRECGIATYSQDLVEALRNKFTNSFSLKVCALESGKVNRTYPEEVKYILDTTDPVSYLDLARTIDNNQRIEIILIQHEFGFFEQAGAEGFLPFLWRLTKPAVIAFHTVLPHPDDSLQTSVRNIVTACAAVIVMTRNSAQVLIQEYGIPTSKIEIIAHGTHLVPHLDKEFLKNKYGLAGKKVLSTFGLLSSGKGIGTTLAALPAIIKANPDVIFLVIGKTHPLVVKSEGEQYRRRLEARVAALGLHDHVIFINRYLPLNDLLECLQLSDIYLFTSKDPNQAVSGTFSYAMSCACPIISTPIPHALEVLNEDTGIIIDFQNSQQLADGVNSLMSDESRRMAFSSSTLQRIVPSAWENSAIAHALLFRRIAGQNRAAEAGTRHRKLVFQPVKRIFLTYRLPEIKLDHLRKMTTDFGIIQFSKINQPDLDSGYTLDDNARALIATCMHYEWSAEPGDLDYLEIYLDFMRFCQQDNGNFLNYVCQDTKFTAQNRVTNLEDANGRAIWALGYLISRSAVLPPSLIANARNLMRQALLRIETMHSTRAMGFALKGLYYGNQGKRSPEYCKTIKLLADRLVAMYHHESEKDWQWYESYLTYANSILPEAMLLAWRETGDPIYEDIAVSTFDFLLARTFNQYGIEVISNKNWLKKGAEPGPPGEQPIDVAYTILALDQFYSAIPKADYRDKMGTAFNWFLGNNRLHQIIYNPCTGGCYDGLEATHVNLNQGAESTISYLLARLTVEKYKTLPAKPEVLEGTLQKLWIT